MSAMLIVGMVLALEAVGAIVLGRAVYMDGPTGLFGAGEPAVGLALFTVIGVLSIISVFVEPPQGNQDWLVRILMISFVIIPAGVAFGLYLRS